MAISKTLLDELRSHSQVDCDTLDYKVAEALGPFVDCTSNQAIAYGELQKPKNATLISESIHLAKELHTKHAADVTLEQLTVEVMMVKLSAKMTPYLTGFAHIQTNPYNAYSAHKTVTNAKRIISIYAAVKPDFEARRICIKIPSTWEGIQACRELENQGIHTLATTLFSMEQVALAADAKCTYIAPYINELKVHFVPGHIDNDKGFSLCRSAQRYYERKSSTTKVLPASLTSTAEVMKLAGANHITVSPPLLAELASTSAALAPATVNSPAAPWFKETDVDEFLNADFESVLRDEAVWRMAFTRGKGGANEKKLVDAINIFADMQDGMEDLVRKAME